MTPEAPCCAMWARSAAGLNSQPLGGLGFRVWGLGFGVWGLGLGVLGCCCQCVRRPVVVFGQEVAAVNWVEVLWRSHLTQSRPVKTAWVSQGLEALSFISVTLRIYLRVGSCSLNMALTLFKGF